MAFKIGSNTVVFDNRVVKFMSGTTAERNALTAGTGLVQGATWWNTSTESFNVYDGVNWEDIGPLYSTQGQIWSWGYNLFGFLGDNTTANKSSPVSVAGVTWCQVSAGYNHTMALRQNGTAWGWGNGGRGQLGDNSVLARSSPFLVVGGFTDWRQVSAGRCFSMALRQNGTAWGWGCNNFGGLGDGTAVGKSSPVSVIGGFTDWCQITAGACVSLGVRTNGSLWAWGLGSGGQLGNNTGGTGTSTRSPVSVVGGFTDWCQVSGGAFAPAAVRQNGTAWAWGNNCCGQLGDNTIVSRSSPVSVVGGFTDWCQISAGDSHALAVRQNGTAWAWGRGSNGQLGDGNTTTRSSPVSVVGGFTDWCQVSAGDGFSLAVRTNSSAWAWGSSACGQLGDNTTTTRTSPVSVVGGFTDWCQVSASTGNRFSIGLRIVS